MGDTQRSQTISPDSQRIAEQIVSSDVGFSGCNSDDFPVLTGQTSLEWLKVHARTEPNLVFTALTHRISFDLLKQSYRHVRKSKSCGVDGVTVEEYAANLDANIYGLLQRLKRGQYVAQPVKRIWIDKEGGKKRPIGISALEDKIVQKGVAKILDVIYDRNFYDFSHGFREGHSQHMALHELREQCRKQNINFIIDADVSGFFDEIDKKLLVEILKQRVNDGGLIRLIGKWLNAGIDEAGELSYPEKGTPQGAVISPVLSNIFLHYVLDDWFIKEVQPKLGCRSFLIRFADDFIIGCELETDAKRVLALLKERFESFALRLHPEKTKLLPFGKPPSSAKVDKRNGTFDFLGFTFYWSKVRKGYWVVKKKTIGKRLNRFIKTVWGWCRDNRHDPIKEQHVALCQKLNGYYQYYGVRGNFKALEVVYEAAEKAWRFWLSRRSHKGRVTWEKFERIRACFPFPKPRIIHNI